MDTIIAAPASCEVLILGRKGILLIEFMAPEITITSKVYGETLNNLRRLIKKKRRGMLTKGVVLLHDARPHTAARTNASIKLFN